MTIQPLVPIPINPLIASLPKADLHLHGETEARLERLVARRRGHLPYDRRSWARQLLDQSPPGAGRIIGIYAPDQGWETEAARSLDPEEDFIARVADVLEEGARDGAVLIEELQHWEAGLSKRGERQCPTPI